MFPHSPTLPMSPSPIQPSASSPRRGSGWISSVMPQPELRSVGVPLSPGCFQPSALQHQQFTDLRRAQQQPFLHAGEWKQVKAEKGLTFFRRLRRGRSLRELALEEDLPEIRRAVERGYTSMICDGHVDGSIEEMMLGMTASSQDDLMTGFSFKNPPNSRVRHAGRPTPHGGLDLGSA
ncbi:hypothetical protein PF005_g26617 [Phytophthora fragariae]|uniref:Uncharacterized protein n=1 Tax=Phytophthora fragariae TaxID=53985 RepID=A0A6A3VSI9_9STRA|nr:hypothetical protein PF009_g26302 [Phytophthora fragariae]KAE9071385.1 hypothetical protein PF010_g25893 [Phytophthora fragariae]KAE9172646.1 hypothetical protein PF005_g26617 [Phytophthora fragariae]